MLSIRTIGASAVALVAGAGMAFAADLPDYQAPPPAQYTPVSAYNWTGPYLGLQGGYGWGTSGLNGWEGGAYAGYNFQLDPNWIVGLEGDFMFTGRDGITGTTATNHSWDASIRGRIGYAYDRFLFYGTGGVAFGDIKGTNTGVSASSTQVGWTAGLGVEAALTQNVTGRLEFRHTDLGTASFAAPVGSIGYQSNDILVGVGFKF
jgi:outer membrane immunogenic protein